ncbi:MAG: hypothetical protein IPK19_22605 [Chloroflexi bacterium]|nr:hypothetical protein [Chloroflexota bacterium]
MAWVMMRAQGEKSLDVVGVGSWSNFDHLFVVERLPLPGDTVQITGPIELVERIFFGGCAPNNVAAAARLGARTGLIGVVGQDFVTRGYQAYFDQLDVNLNGAILVPEGLCGHSFLYSEPDGKSVCLSHLGAAARQEEYEPNAEVLEQTKVAVINYRFDRFTLCAAQLVRNAGGIVIASGAVMTAPDYADAICRTTHLLICTEHELQQLITFLGLDNRSSLFGLGIRAIIATRGTLGSQIITPNDAIDIPIVLAERVVDPTGAGDGFVGGVAFGIAAGYSLEDSARFGAVVASFVVEAWGCQTNLPTFARAAERYIASFSALPVPESPT